ncbi:MAG: proton-conducting transporter membrane subunit, partial [Geminicoccaceae bacterium]
MSPLFALTPWLAPLGLLAAASIAHAQPGLRPWRALLAARLASLSALAVALAGLALLLQHGPMTSPLLGAFGFGLAVRLDPLSVTLALLVAFIGAVVVQYARNYLDGDARQGAFMGDLCLTLAAVLMLVTAGNLVQLVLAWIGTSLALHRLLVFYPERDKAVLAARKKFIAARIGDICLLTGALGLALTFGTGDIATILADARAMAGAETLPAMVPLAAVLIALAALLKSAQFPLHGWLPEVMETPTPVSALLHAGIINAGGFLIVRLADLVLLYPPAMHLLAVIGGFTALFAAVVMLTQTSIKVALAWSTIAQMGFMLLQCGLGA